MVPGNADINVTSMYPDDDENSKSAKGVDFSATTRAPVHSHFPSAAARALLMRRMTRQESNLSRPAK